MSLKYTGNQTERVYSPELNNMAYVSNNAVLEGCTPIQNLGSDMKIKVEAGEIFFGLNRYEASASSAITVTANATSFSRIDTILITSAGTVSVLAGTAGSIPKPADYDPDSYIALGLITVTAGATAITNAMIKDIRVLNTGGSGGGGAIATVNVFRETFVAQTTVVVTHGLDDYYPTVQVYNDSDVLIPSKDITSITATGDDVVTVVFGGATSGTIVVQGGKAGISIGVNKYYEEFTAQTALTVTHDLNDLYPQVQIYNNSGELILADVTVTSVNIVNLAFASAESGYVVIHGGITGEGSIIQSPGTITDADFVQFDGVTGTEVKDGLALQTTITDSDIKVPSSGAVVDYSLALSYLQTTISDSATKVPSSSAVVDYAADLARIQTTITDDDVKLPSSGAVVDYVIPKTYLQTTITDSDTKVPSSGAVVDYATGLTLGAFKASSSTYTDNDTAQTFSDAFCTAASLITIVITDASNPQGVWSVASGAGSFIITSTIAETNDIDFDYYIQKVAV